MIYFPVKTRWIGSPHQLLQMMARRHLKLKLFWINKRSGGVRVAGLAKWTGYTEPTWEPADAMEGVTALDEFERLRGLESEEGCIVRD